MNLFQLATRGVDLGNLPDEEAPRQGVAFEPSTNGGKFSVPSDLNDAFEFAAKDFGVDPDVLRAVAYAESRFHPDVVSGKVKSKTGATGLMQFMPKTAQEYGIDPLDPVQSIFGAAAYLRKSLDKFDGDYGKAVASYNAGPNRKDFDAEDWDARMPAETQGYLRTVFTAADQLKQGGAATAKPVQPETQATKLPAGVNPSTAGGGRGSVSPGDINTKLPRIAVPDMTAGSVAQDVLSGALQVGPTAVKGAGELVRLATGDRMGKGITDFADRGIKATQDVIGSDRAAAQRQNLNADMADDSVSLGRAIVDNKGAWSDQILPTLGSMILPIGVAGAAGKAATVGKVAQGLDTAALAARVASVQQAAGIGATAAQNAANTFAEMVDKGVSMPDAYKAAGITVPFSLLAGKLTGGGAEGALIKGLSGKSIAKGAVELAKAPVREGFQEGGEALGQVTGEVVGSNQDISLQTGIKRVGTEALLGFVVGGGTGAAQQLSAPTVESQPTTPTAPQVTPSNGVYPKPVNGVYPNSTATQAVDNIAALLKQTEANIDGTATQATPVQPGQQTVDAGAAPVAQGPADSGGGLAATGEAAATGQSESAQSLTDAPSRLRRIEALNTERSAIARQLEAQGQSIGDDPLGKAIQAATSPLATRDVDWLLEALTYSEQTNRTDIAQEVKLRLTELADKLEAESVTDSVTPGVATDNPKYETIAANLRARRESKGLTADAIRARLKSQQAGALTQQPVLQNRDRSNPASITQMQSIASNPDYGRLGFSRDFANGAPVVAGAEQNVPAQQRGKQDTAVAVDGTRIPVQYAVVDAGEVLTSNNVDGTSNTAYGDANTPAIRAIAGNGRVAGLTAAYRQGTAAQYKQELMADTALHGVPAEVIQGMQNPVLVRVMPQEAVTANIGDLSNTQGNLSLSAVEQAKNDVSRVNLAALEFDEAGGLTQKAVRQFVQAMPKAEQGGLIDTNGQPSKQAVDRLQAAVFAKAYGNDQLVRLFAQAQDPEARLILSAMAQLAPKIARLEGAGALDIRPIIAQAAEIAVNARREGKSIALAAKQMDMAADPAVGVVLDLFASSPRSNKSIIEAIANAADFAYAEASKPDEDMFGPVEKATRDDVINTLKPKNEPASQTNLEQPTGRVAAENNAVGKQADTGAAADTGATEAGGPAQEASGQVTEPGAEYSVRQQFSLFGDEQSDQLQLFIDRGPDPVQAGPGAVAAQRESVAALADLHATEAILAATLARDYAARQRISLVGQTVKSAEDLAVLAQVYRDPRFETFRVVFVDAGGKVVSQLGLTSRLPASAAAIMGTDTYAYLNGLSAAAKKAGATGYYLLHNHPSGQARASTADVRLTNTFDQHLPGLKLQSHVVIDTNEYSTIEGGFANLIKKDFGVFEPLGATRVTFNKPEDVVAYTKRLQAEPGAVTLIATDAQFTVKGITTIPAAELDGPKGLLRLKVARALMRLQSSNVFAVGRESGALAKLSGIVVDAIHIEESGKVTSLTARGIINSTNLGAFPSDRRTRVTADSSPEFAYLRFDPSAMKSAGQRVAEGDLFSPSANAWQSDLFGTPAPEPAKPKTETEAKAQREEQTPAITSPTPADIEAQQDRAKRTERTVKAEKTAADEQAKRERERKDIAQASVGAADSFELGQSAEDNLSGQEGLKFSRASDNKAARAALAKIMEKGVTSPDDLRDLLRVPGYSKWAESTITGDMAATTALRGELQQAFSGSDWKAPKLNDQGIISVYSDWDGFTAQNIDKLTKLADKYDAPIGVRGGAATKQLVNRLDGFGFELYNGLQERADRMPNVMFGMIRPAGGITATTPLFSRATQSPSTPVSTIRQAIAKAYGNLLTRLEGKGLVTLTQTEEEAIAAAAQARADQNGGDVEAIKESLRKSVLASVAATQFREDIPNETWLQGKIDYARQAPRSQYGVPEMGSVTGYFRGNVMVPVRWAKDVPGQRGEQSNVRQDDLEAIRSIIRETGKMPIGDDGQEYVPYIEIGYDGKPWVSEGNHRIMAAAAEGLGYIPAEVRYFDGGQRNAGKWNPKNLLEITQTQSAEIDIRRSADGNLEGFFDPATGKSFLIADNLTAESAPATLMHEVGIHRAAEGGGKMGAVIERAGGILRIERNNEFVQRVQSRMDEAGETSNEEAAAYIVTEYEKDRTNAPASVKQWIKDFIADVRAWLFNKGVLLKAGQLTVADIAAVARANANRMAQGDGRTGDGGRKFSRGTNESMTNKDVVGNQGGRFTEEQAAEEIANDDDLFNTIAEFTADDPDIFESKPEMARRLRSILAKVTPYEPWFKTYYRGEPSNSPATDRKRGFRSWSGNERTAKEFADEYRDGVVRQRSGKSRAVAISTIFTARMRVRDGESHYPGDQAESFILDGDESTAPDSGGAMFSRGTTAHMPENKAPGPQGDAQQGASTGNAVAVSRQIAQAIQDDDDPYADYGLRVIPPEADVVVQPGDELPPSNQWDDGTDTGEALDGTSAARIDGDTEGAALKAIRLIGAHGKPGPNGYYYGDQVVLIKGKKSGVGEDVGEILLNDAVVVATWRKPDKGNSEVAPNEQSTPTSQGVRFSRSTGDTSPTGAQDAFSVKGATADQWDGPLPSKIRRSVRGGGQQAQQNLALNTPSPAWMLPASTKTDALVYEIQDQKVDLKRTQEAIKAAGRTITEPFDARMAETLMPGRVAYRTETFLKTEVAPLMEAMAKNNVTQNQLSDYLLARHAPERNAQIAKVNPDPDMQDGGAGTNSQGVRMTTQAANDYIAALTTGKRMVLQLLANKIDAITASTRDMLVREGLEKQSTMDAWTGAYKHYVPLFKDEAVESPAHPIGSGMSVTGSASKRAMGSEGEVTNMVAHILMQREAAITRAEKNRVAMSLYGLALSNPNQEVWTTIRPNMRADKIGAELAAMGVDPVEAEQGMQGVPTIRTINAVTGLVQETPNPMYKRLENALVVKVDGEDRVILFNAKNADAMRMVRALKNQDGLTNFDLAGSMVGTATRYFASINTQYNPAFGMVNVVRDIGGALVNLTTTGIADKKAKVLGDIPAAMKGIARDVRGDQTRTPWSDLWVQFQEDGGRTGYRDLFIDPFKRAEAVQKDLDAMQRDGTASAGRVAHSILDLLDDFNTTLENGVRLSAYKAALDKGMSRPAAAKMARELTVDFNRKGRTGREVGPLYAFFNASVQGTARTIESLKGPAGKKIVAGGLMLGVIQSLMLAAAGFDDDEPPEFVKARAFIIPMGDKRYIAIPLQFGLNALPNTGRVITDLMLTGGKDAGKKTFNAIGEIMGSFNPLGGGNIFTAHGLLTTVAPTVADPLVDLATNTNFAGTPIGKDRADWDTRPGAKLARESTQRSLTGQAYIGISKAINAASGGNEFKKGLASPTPEQVQYVFTTAGGGLYRELEKTLNIAGLKADGMEVKSRMIPLGGRFAGEADDQDTQRSRYYRNSERLAALEAELKGFEKAGNEAAVRRIETERSDEVDLLGDYKHIRQAITKLNKLAADNINDMEMLKELDAERLELMRELNDSVRKLEKRSELFKRD